MMTDLQPHPLNQPINITTSLMYIIVGCKAYIIIIIIIIANSPAQMIGEQRMHRSVVYDKIKYVALHMLAVARLSRIELVFACVLS